MFKKRDTKDTSNFDKDFTSEEPVLTPTDPMIIKAINQDEFKDFSFINTDWKKYEHNYDNNQVTQNEPNSSISNNNNNSISSLSPHQTITSSLSSPCLHMSSLSIQSNSYNNSHNLSPSSLSPSLTCSSPTKIAAFLTANTVDPRKSDKYLNNTEI